MGKLVKMRQCFWKVKFCTSARCLYGLFLVLCFVFRLSQPARITRELLDDNVQSYLMKFGYIEGRGDVASAYRTEDSIRNAIRDLQKFAGIPASGILDEATQKLMRSPRCGMPDDYRTSVASHGHNSRRTKRFVVHGSKWPKTDLTWSLRSWGNLNRENVTHVIAKALEVWSKHSKLEFRNVDERQHADIIIYFYSRDHGDRFPFDGKGIVLAHAFFPTGNGHSVDVHFDADEDWITGGVSEPGSTNLFNVAAHEIGHSLGLGHSSVENALMYPWYKEITDGFDYELPEDDRNGIQSLYGRRDANTRIWDKIPQRRPIPTTTFRPRTRYSPTPFIPYNPYHGHHHPPYHPRTEKPEKPYYPPKPMHPDKKPHYPKPAGGYPDRRYPDHYPTKHRPHHHTPDKYPPDRYPTRHYPNKNYPRPETPVARPDRPPERVPTRHHPVKESPLPPPNTCDTSYDAVAMIRREVFIFKDAYFWRIGDQGIIPGYPALIHRLWPDLPHNLTHVDAVYENSDGKIVFFIGRQYYVFIGQKLEWGYPKPLTHLGLSDDLEKIDGAMVWGHNSQTYFYSGNMYWRFDETIKKVELDYPRNMAMWKGVGTDIDAVFQWRDGKTYFFKGKGFWKFNDNKMRVEHEEQKASAPFWMGCSDNFEDNEVLEKLPYREASKSAKNVLNTSVVLALLIAAGINMLRINF